MRTSPCTASWLVAWLGRRHPSRAGLSPQRPGAWKRQAPAEALDLGLPAPRTSSCPVEALTLGPLFWQPWDSEKQDHSRGDLTAASSGRAPGPELPGPEQLSWAG